MSNWSWKAGLVVVAIVGATAYAIAQMGPGMQGPMTGMSEVMQRHHQMMQGQQGMHGPMMEHHAMMMGQTHQPTMPGQAAFGTIQEVVQILESDPDDGLVEGQHCRVTRAPYRHGRSDITRPSKRTRP